MCLILFWDCKFITQEEYKFMKYKLVCDYQENFESITMDGHINDHQDKETFENLLKAIKNKGHHCDILEGVPELLNAINNKITFENTIFLNLSDGMSQKYSRVQIPILCELLGVPYSGGNAFTVALTTNKYYTKLALEKVGVKTPSAILVTNNGFPDELTLKMLQYPVIVKPNTEGSSVGITNKSICQSESELLPHLNEMLQLFDEVLVEKFIAGYDVTDFIIGNKGKYYINEPLIALKKGKLIQGLNVMSYMDYINRDNWYTTPNGSLTQTCIESIKNTSIIIAEYLKTYDIARIDYRVTKDNEIYFLEINTVPAIHKKSQAGAICEHLGISFDDFVDYLIKTVCSRIFDK